MADRPVALVTGAGRGIGRGIALQLAENGFDVAGNDILYDPKNTRSGLFEVKERVEKSNALFVPVQGDIASLNDHEKILDTVLTQLSRIDLLVNNAGIAPEKRVDVLETSPESFDRLLSINARGAFFLTQRIAKLMISQRHVCSSVKPSIIFITSVSAEVSSVSRAEYCISKAALSQAAKVFADRLTEYGINVYEIRPGIIETDMTAPVRDTYDKRIAEGLVPQRRWGVPEDVGKAVVALATGYFGYSTGHIFELSGGMNIRRL
jgi:NAD(P)-dependent dehydrogenase (short-subunit alcohol dehydrogenase family)